MFSVKLNSRVLGIDNLRKAISKTRELAGLGFAEDKLMKIVERRTRDRIANPAYSEYQKSPDGVKWRRPSRKQGHPLLYQTQTLAKSITTARTKLRDSDFKSNTKLGFRVGVDGSAKNKRGVLVAKYGEIQQETRPFIGMSKGDIKATTGLLTRLLDKEWGKV